jgi:hypothetical protein
MSLLFCNFSPPADIEYKENKQEGSNMQLFDSLSRIMGNLFKEGNDEIFLYILVFLLFFNKNSSRSETEITEDRDSSYSIFFIVLFLFLIINGGIDFGEHNKSIA